MIHRNLTTCHLPGIHDHIHIAASLLHLWKIGVSTFNNKCHLAPTDKGANIVEAFDEDIQKIYIPCAGHTLNPSVKAAFSVRGVVARCYKIVSHFNQSRVQREELINKQQQLELPQHSLIEDNDTRWNSMFWQKNVACNKLLWWQSHCWKEICLRRLI